MSKNRLNLVVATSKNNGIGINGQLPWRLKGDMAFFKRITSTTADPEKKNAVIMGRKTWDSIPSKFKPLAGRVNIILSRTLRAAPAEGTILAMGLDDALAKLDDHAETNKPIESIFVIGGSSIYEAALNHPACYRIYLTQVLKDYDCDTFMPKYDRHAYETVSVEGVPEEIQQDGDVQYQFTVLEKILTMNIMCAMCANRGIGYKNGLPWPFIKKDYDYYMETIGRHTNGLPNVCLYGRVTWESARETERNMCSKRNVVISRAYRPPNDENVWFVAPSLSNAVERLTREKETIGTVWVMGGQLIFEAAISHRACERVHVTVIDAEYQADAFMPEFEHKFALCSEEISSGNENQPTLKFQVWTRNDRIIYCGRLE